MPVLLFLGQVLAQPQNAKMKDLNLDLNHRFVIASQTTHFLNNDTPYGKDQVDQSPSKSGVYEPQCLTTWLIRPLAKKEPQYSAVSSIVTAAVLGGAALFTYSPFNDINDPRFFFGKKRLSEEEPLMQDLQEHTISE